MKKSTSTFGTWYAISIAFQLGFIIALPVVGFTALGILADRALHTLPLFVIIGILGGIVTSFYEMFHFLKPLLKE